MEPERRASDIVNDALVPGLLVLAMWLFGGYVLSVREALYAGGAEILAYVYFFFVVATVLIAKMRSVKSEAAKAGGYHIALGVAMLLFVLRFSSEAGGVVGTAGGFGALLINLFAFALAGIGIDWISRDCAVDPEAEETATGSWFDPVPRDKRRPGRALIVFSLFAACVFGAGQLALARTSSGLYTRGFVFAAGYAACAMLLLALTNLGGLRLYVASRKLRAPSSMVAYWLAASSLIAALALAAAWALPKSGGYAGQSVFASAPSGDFGSGGQAAFRDAPASGLNAPKAPPTSGHAGEASAPGEVATRAGGKAPQPAEGPGEDLAPSETGDRTIAGGGTEHGEGQGEGEPNPDPDAEQGEAPKEGDGPPTAASGAGERGQRGARQVEGSKPSAGREEPRQEPPRQERRPPPPPVEARAENAPSLPDGSLLTRLLMVIGGIVLGVAAAVWLWRWLSRLRGFRLPPLVVPWFGRSRRRPRELTNPFADHEALSRLTPRELVLHTYEAFMALARVCGAPRPRQATASEYLRALPPTLAGLSSEATDLSSLYLRAEYAPEADLSGDVERIREIWERMEEFLAAWLKPAEAGQGVKGGATP